MEYNLNAENHVTEAMKRVMMVLDYIYGRWGRIYEKLIPKWEEFDEENHRVYFYQTFSKR